MSWPICARAGTAVDVVHQAGLGHEAEVASRYRALGIDARVVGFDHALPEHWRWSDAALCSAGAGTLGDALATGTPALVVPIDRVSRRHQEANARALAERSDLLDWVAESDWTAERETARLVQLLSRPKQAPGRQPATDRLVHRLRGVAGGPEPVALAT